MRSLAGFPRPDRSWPGPLSRRAFIRLAGTGSLLAWAGCANRQAVQRAGIVDTHTHFYDPRRPQGVPWPPQDDAFLCRPVLPKELKQLAEPLGVAGTVVVEASSRVDDNQWVLDLAAHEPFILGLVGHLKPGRPGFREDLARFESQPLFRGIRTGLWGISLAPDSSEFIGDLRRLADRDLALDLLVGPEQLAVAVRLAAALPSLRMVVNHCANVPIDGAAPPQSWTKGIRAAARHHNLHVKISGLVEGSGRKDQSAPADVDFYRPVLDVIWNTFGEDRVLFGSNWPVSARFGTYATVLQIVSDYFHEKGPRASEKYFRGNAARVYKFVHR